MGTIILVINLITGCPFGLQQLKSYNLELDLLKYTKFTNKKQVFINSFIFSQLQLNQV